jgi:hypothetical protein
MGSKMATGAVSGSIPQRVTASFSLTAAKTYSSISAHSGLQGLHENQTISYDVQTERGKEAAANLKA